MFIGLSDLTIITINCIAPWSPSPQRNDNVEFIVSKIYVSYKYNVYFSINLSLESLNRNKTLKSQNFQLRD